LTRGPQEASKNSAKSFYEKAYYIKTKRLTVLSGLELITLGAAIGSAHLPLLPRQSSHHWAFMLVQKEKGGMNYGHKL